MLAIYRQYRLPPPRALLSVLAAPIVRYVGAGGIGTLAHYATLALMVESTGMPPSSATVVGALVGALINYLLNYHFTFASHASHRKTLPKFMVVAAISAALNGAVLHLSTRELDVHYLVAQLASTFIVLILGFVLNRLWTFRDSAPALAHAVSVTPPAAQLAGERGAREPAEDNRPFEENPPSAGSWAP